MNKSKSLKRTLYRYVLATVVCALVVVDLAIILSLIVNDEFVMPLIPTENSVASESQSTAPVIKEPVDTFDDYVPTNAEAEFVPGIYYKNIEHYNINLIPNIIFYEDGTFDFIENAKEWMYHNTGIYEVSKDGKTIVCYVQIAEISVPDALVFKVDDDGTLVYMNDPGSETGQTTYIKDLV